MLCVAMLSAEVVKVAVRVLPVPPRAPVPSVAAPSLNVTVPVGFEPVTVAVNVTLAPHVDGLALLATVVVVLAFAAALAGDPYRPIANSNASVSSRTIIEPA